VVSEGRPLGSSGIATSNSNALVKPLFASIFTILSAMAVGVLDPFRYWGVIVVADAAVSFAIGIALRVAILRYQKWRREREIDKHE
jgi:hypothetical protein